jgi:biopolymer transport protein ExbD
MKFPRNARIFRGQLDASPFVGVLFLVAIFLLLNSSLVFTTGVAVRLPEASDLPGVTNATAAVAIDQAGRLYYQNQIVSYDNLKLKLREAVRQARGPLTLVLLADESVPHDQEMRLLTLAREVGLKDALYATREPAFAPARTNSKP